jgi:hypothetical protein
MPLEMVRRLVAASPAFRAWVGVDHEADPVGAAREFIHLVEVSKQDDAARPYALITHGFDLNAIAVAGGGGAVYADSGEVFLRFLADVDAQYKADAADAMLDFGNVVGDILDEVSALSETGEYMRVREFSILDLYRADETVSEGEGDFIEIIIAVRWGGAG